KACCSRPWRYSLLPNRQAAFCNSRRKARRYLGREFHATRDLLDSLAPKMRRKAYNIIENVRHIRPLEKLTEQVNGKHRFVEHIPLIMRSRCSESGNPTKVFLDRLLHGYIDSMSYDRKVLLSRYQLVDFARKVVGVGSVGTRCWVLLLQGIDDNDSLFLQIKEAQHSVLAPYIGIKLPFGHQGRR